MGRPVKFRTAIYEAAARLFGEQGLDATSIRQIADAAGVSEAALYRHWDGKLDLAWEVFRSGLQTLQDRLVECIGADDRPSAAIRNAVECFYRSFDENRQLFGFVLLHQHELWTRMTDKEPNPVRAWIELMHRFTEGLPKEELSQPGVLAAVTLGIVLRPAVATLYGRLEGPLLSHAPIVARAVCRVMYVDVDDGAVDASAGASAVTGV